MNILSLHTSHHDANFCTLKDGSIIYHNEIERFTRIKHSAGFPKNAIRFCLDFANINLSEIEHIAINRNPKQKIFSNKKSS